MLSVEVNICNEWIKCWLHQTEMHLFFNDITQKVVSLSRYFACGMIMRPNPHIFCIKEVGVTIKNSTDSNITWCFSAVLSVAIVLLIDGYGNVLKIVILSSKSVNVSHATNFLTFRCLTSTIVDVPHR